ncbi:MAG: hypothetical protein AAF806_28980, partial [Bacteroidota bacterium]
MEKINFSKCTLPYLEQTFSLESQKGLPALKDWLSMKIEISEEEKRQLLNFQDLLDFNLLHWNEQELSLNFIGPVFAMVRFSSKKFNFFAQRSLNAVVNDIELFGKT